MRFVRYRLLGRVWPAHHEILRQTEKTIITEDVAVVIPCHNYGVHLARAIDSVLNQSVQPSDILIIDDSSTDGTREVAESYVDRGVRYLRVEHRSLALSRNSGAQATTATYLLFLDADDWMRNDYIEKCLQKMHPPKIAFVYADRQHFGDNNDYMQTPEFDAAQLSRGNYIASNALIWRQAFDAVGGYRDIPHALEDWDFYRRLSSVGYKGARADTLSYIFVHENSMLAALAKDPKRTYARDAALLHYPVTIFTPFAGRTEIFDRYLAALRSIDFDPQMIRIHWYDTSGDPAFESLLRTAMSTLPFGRTTYSKSPLPALWKVTPQSLIRNRIDMLDQTEYLYQMAVVRAFNDMVQFCNTQFVLTLEDDIQMEPDTLKLLLESMQHDVAAVVAPYKSGFYPRYEVWVPDGFRAIHFTKKRTGIEEVGGCGCGCTLFRTSMLKQIAPLFTGVRDTPKQWYDQATYLRLAQHGKILCNWDAEVEHMQTERYKEKLNPAFV